MNGERFTEGNHRPPFGPEYPWPLVPVVAISQEFKDVDYATVIKIAQDEGLTLHWPSENDLERRGHNSEDWVDGSYISAQDAKRLKDLLRKRTR